MEGKGVPFTRERIEKIMSDHPTPFYIYDEAGIRESARALSRAFSWVPGGFRNFFAVKACPNPHILKILAREGLGTDCSSLPELVMSERAGISGEDVMFTSNDTPADEFRKAVSLGAIINLDDITHIPFLEKKAGIPDVVCFRYNPGKLVGGNRIIGNPEESKFGLRRDQIFSAYESMKSKGVRRFGLHAMVASNVLDEDYIINAAGMLFGLATEISGKLGIEFEFINLGGGIGIPYRPEERPVDLESLSGRIRKSYEKKFPESGSSRPMIFMECGRLMTGPHGYLVTNVRHVARKHRDFVGMDACMANLMRPGIYGAYHHITVMGKEGEPKDHVYDVTGGLCENNDKFAVQRHLPEIEPGDILVIHDAGSHGHSMGFQYNGKLRSAELLLTEDGRVRQIRRAETPEDYFSTINFPD